MSRLSGTVLFFMLNLMGNVTFATWESRSKIHPLIRDGEVTRADGFLCVLKSRGNIRAADSFRTKARRARFIYETRRRVARESQADLLAVLEQGGATYRSFWIVNAVWVGGDRALLQKLAARDDVARIVPNPRIVVSRWDGEHESGGLCAPPPKSTPWGIERVGAPIAWELGITGSGAVIAGADSGYDWQHKAVIRQYRGFSKKEARHDYHWHDAIHSDVGDCPGDSSEPCDDSGHGTHTLGTMVGSGDGEDPIGMAPGAEWIGCRNMQEGVGTPARYIECYEFFLAPYPIGGDALKDGEPEYAPDVISNSWECPPTEGCDADTLREVVDTVRAAGILNVTTAGNDGPDCFSVAWPPGIYKSAFTVGGTNNKDEIADFSGLGPVEVDGGVRLKPDVVAPGVHILSSIPGGGYGAQSGTSVACPHVSGMAALLIDADPSLAGDPTAIEDVIKRSALPLTSPIRCGDFDSDVHPNPIFGYGRIDVPRALEHMGVIEPVPIDGGMGTDSNTDPPGKNDASRVESGACGCKKMAPSTKPRGLFALLVALF